MYILFYSKKFNTFGIKIDKANNVPTFFITGSLGVYLLRYSGAVTLLLVYRIAKDKREVKKKLKNN